MLNEKLAFWLTKDHKAHLNLKKISQKEQKTLAVRADNLLSEATKNQSLRVLIKNKKPVALLMRSALKEPRVPNQQSLHLKYDKSAYLLALPWIKKSLGEVARNSPRFTQIYLSPKQDLELGKVLKKNQFNVRYEILAGNPNIALKQLMLKKSPADNLNHLGLELKSLTKSKDLDSAMKLQKKVSLKARSHTYFAHTKDQLAKDRKTYEQFIKKKTGLLLGIYRGKKIVGLMVGDFDDVDKKGTKYGSFSFYLDTSIQGLGITKVGYRVLLEFFVKNKVKKFYGGTSQPAIQSLGKVMKRKLEHVIYVKF